MSSQQVTETNVSERLGDRAGSTDPHGSVTGDRKKQAKEFNVWAPAARSVHIEAGGRRQEMRLQESGWWSVSLGSEGPLDYAFIVNDGQPLPDPRSQWQPHGVHGPSRTVDHDSFTWSDAGWQPPPLRAAVFYELHVGTFTPEGTFEAAIDRISYLRDLGITHVELMPVAQFPGAWGWGYDGVDLYAPHESYGGPEGLKRLVDALHANGIAAVLDVVYNHVGPSGNYLGQYGPYFTDALRTPWGDAVNFSEAGSDEVRSFFLDNAAMWLRDYHFDGLRIDAVHAILDNSATHFLEELANRVKALEAELRRHLLIIAESDLNDPRLLMPAEAGGYGYSGQWSDDFHHALHTVLTGELSGYYADFGTLKILAKAIQRGFVYDGCYSRFRNRRHGRHLDPPLRPKLLGFLQNHDQIGNRAKGERIGALAGLERQKIGAALVLMGPFVPMLFQGEEWAASTPFPYFTNHQEWELGRAVSEGRRREFAKFGWDPDEIPDPQVEETFLSAKLPWPELHTREHADMFAWYRDLIALRKQTSPARSGEPKVAFEEDKRFLIMDWGKVSVAANLNDASLTSPGWAGAELLRASKREVMLNADELVLPSLSVAILSRSQS
jgi:maltooligosyltrehalose trehalohydrolase